MERIRDENLSEDSRLVREIYARYGLAMYWAQCVERELALALSTSLGPQPTINSAAEYDRQLEERFEKTFGTLARELERKCPQHPVILSQQLHQGLRLRNFLAHNFFWERAAMLASESLERRLELLDELDEATDALRVLNEALTAISKEWRQRHGITEELVADEMEKLKGR